MDSELARWLIGLFALVLIQIAIFAYGYGKLTQKVTDLCGRVNKLPCQLNRSKDD